MLSPYKFKEDMTTLPEQSYFIELIQPSYILVIGTFLIFFFWPEFWFIPILYALYLILKRVMKTKQQRYIWTEQLVQMQTGTFSKIGRASCRDREYIAALARGARRDERRA